ncbi:MAG: hypothetical protein ACOZB3_08620, partial [Calditrichota bacterium]
MIAIAAIGTVLAMQESETDSAAVDSLFIAIEDTTALLPDTVFIPQPAFIPWAGEQIDYYVALGIIPAGKAR